MKSKLIVTLLLSMVIVSSTWAKERPEVKCVLTLNDGKTVEGWFLKEGFSTYGPDRLKNVDEITITPTKDGKEGTTYKADYVKVLKCIYEKEGLQKEYRSLYALKPMTRPLNLKHSNHKFFWMVGYQGKKVIGFISDASVIFRTSATERLTSKTTAYSYCVEGDEVVVTYYAPSGGIDIGSKSELKMNFERFPEMVELIKSKDFSVKEMKDKPFAMLETLDQYLAK